MRKGVTFVEVLVWISLFFLVGTIGVCAWQKDDRDQRDCKSKGGRIVKVHGPRGGGWFCEETRARSAPREPKAGGE